MKKRTVQTILSLMLIISLFGGLSYVSANAAEGGIAVFFVAANGNDSNDGSIDKPFTTLEKARDAIRALRAAGSYPSGGAVVYIREGAYQLSDSFKLEKQDSGEEKAPVVYRAYKNEKVRIVGGGNLDSTKFTKVIDKDVLARLPKESADKILQIDLKAQGITEFGEITKGVFNGLGYPKPPAAPELFFNSKSMTLARFPNAGEYMYIGDVKEQGTVTLWYDPANKNRAEYVPLEKRPIPPIGGTFTYKSDRPKRWTKAKDIWMKGTWYQDWYEEILKVEKLDTIKKAIKVEQATVYGIKAGQKFYCYNLLEEIDVPGEWYLDRGTGMLYMYPLEKIEGANIVLSSLAKPLIQFEDASNIVIKGLTLEAGRVDGIEINNGENNLVYNCTLRLLGKKGVVLKGGKNNGVVGCEMYDTGTGGVSMTGGDRQTLTPAGHYAENNNIHNVDRLVSMYSDGVLMTGVGNRASHNEIYNQIHEAMEFTGNDHVMEYNYIHDVVKESSDAGAIYTGRDVTARGNIIRNNFLKNIKSGLPGVSPTSVMAIYFDDVGSSAEITGNIFYNIMNGVYINGGRDYKVSNNIFAKVAAGSSAITLTTWGGQNMFMAPLKINTPFDSVNPENAKSIGLDKVPFDKEPYNKYPHMNNILNDELLAPKYNEFTNNVYYKSALGETVRLDGSAIPEAYVRKNNTFKNNLTTMADPGFVNEAEMNLMLKDDAPVYGQVKDFQAIPFDKIGRYTDALDKKMANATALFIGSPVSMVNNTEKFVDETNLQVMPLVKDGRTLVPVRFIAENFGAKVGWNGDTKEVAVELGGQNIKLQLDSKQMTINGSGKELDVPAQAINGRTMIPLRALVEAMGKKVFWDNRGLIIISNNDKILDAASEKTYIDEMVRRVGTR